MRLLGNLLLLFLLFFNLNASAQTAEESAKIRQILFVAGGNLTEFIKEIPIKDIYPHADAYGKILQNPTRVEALQNGKVIGHIILNTDFVNSNGYSGKPIHILIALDLQFNIVKALLVKHSEPIVLIGIPIEKVNAFINSYEQRNYQNSSSAHQIPDVISGATVTVMVINESIARASFLAAQAMQKSPAEALPQVPEFIYQVNQNLDAIKDWSDLLTSGAVQNLRFKVGEINQRFAAVNAQAAQHSESDNPDDEFIDLYFAPLTQASLGKSLLGENQYQQLLKRLPEGKNAILVAANGLYSFKGSGYVRGGIFDRIKISQGKESFHFRDRNHQRLADVMAKGAPRFREVALFVVPDENKLDLSQEWQLELLINRSIGATEKVFITAEKNYRLPDEFLIKEKNPEFKEITINEALPQSETLPNENIQLKIAKENWQKKIFQIVILSIALLILLAVFMFQEWISAHPRFYKRFRIAYLSFTLLYLGFYLGAQLSVVNVLTFTNSLINGFDWTYFLMDPIIFILWAVTAFITLMWNRGAFCGWLCPFGALQELSNNLAKKLGLKQWKIPFKVHERLTAIKYMIFIALFGVSLYDLGLAEHFAEIEPFKTSIILKFQRAWPYLLFVFVLLFLGLFVERFFCRYLCPMGAALAIPAKLRLFNWLKRYRECGNPCQKCAQECPVEAIFPEGNINENECIQCLNCQVLYHDKSRCMHLLIAAAKAEKAAERAARIQEIKQNRS